MSNHTLNGALGDATRLARQIGDVTQVFAPRVAGIIMASSVLLLMGAFELIHQLMSDASAGLTTWYGLPLAGIATGAWSVGNATACLVQREAVAPPSWRRADTIGILTSALVVGSLWAAVDYGAGFQLHHLIAVGIWFGPIACVAGAELLALYIPSYRERELALRALWTLLAGLVAVGVYFAPMIKLLPLGMLMWVGVHPTHLIVWFILPGVIFVVTALCVWPRTYWMV